MRRIWSLKEQFGHYPPAEVSSVLEPHSQTELQKEPGSKNGLMQLVWYSPSLRKPQDSKLMKADIFSVEAGANIC